VLCALCVWVSQYFILWYARCERCVWWWDEWTNAPSLPFVSHITISLLSVPNLYRNIICIHCLRFLFSCIKDKTAVSVIRITLTDRLHTTGFSCIMSQHSLMHTHRVTFFVANLQLEKRSLFAPFMIHNSIYRIDITMDKVMMVWVCWEEETALVASLALSLSLNYHHRITPFAFESNTLALISHHLIVSPVIINNHAICNVTQNYLLIGLIFFFFYTYTFLLPLVSNTDTLFDLFLCQF